MLGFEFAQLCFEGAHTVLCGVGLGHGGRGLGLLLGRTLLCAHRLLLGLLGAQAGCVSLLGAGLQADAVGFAARLLDVGIELARAGRVGGDLGALAGDVCQVVGLGRVAVIGPHAVGLGECVGGLLQFELRVLVDGRVSCSGAHCGTGLFQRGRWGGAGAGGQQAYGNQAGAQGGGSVKKAMHGQVFLEMGGGQSRGLNGVGRESKPGWALRLQRLALA